MKNDKYVQCARCGVLRPPSALKSIFVETDVQALVCGSGCLVEQPPAIAVDPAKPGADQTVGVALVPGPVEYVPPVDERKVALAYREKVLEAFREWDMRPSDKRTWHEVVMAVDLP